MQLSSDVRIPDGLLAANALLSEKPHQGVPSWNLALHQGIDERNSTAAIGLRVGQHLNRAWSRYTGKERDTESGNDYFGARYFGSSMGRFLSPDWAAKATPIPYANLGNPQSLNLYGYVLNNPLAVVDHDGHAFGDGLDCSGSNASGPGCQAVASWNQEHNIQGFGNEPQAQQQNSSSGGTSFWQGLSNLFHGHSWNYIKTSVTDSETYTIPAGPNGYVTAATDTAGIVGTVAPKMAKDLHLGPLSAGASILNDPSPKNTFTNLLGLAPGFDGPLAVTGAFNDFLTWGAENGQGRVGPKAYGSDQLTPTLPTQDGGCQAAGLPSC